ncbi:hypothetical protein ABTE17_21135, partial [Acinetobacter baumannii]
LVSPTPAAVDRFYAVATHWGKSSFAASTWPLDKTVPLIRGLGVQEVRDETSWMSVESTRGTFSLPPHAQDLQTAAQDNGLKMLF